MKVKQCTKNKQKPLEEKRSLVKNLLLGCSLFLVFSALFLSPDSNRGLTHQDRTLSIDNGDGTCKWQPPAYTIPEDIDFYKTIIAGYPR